MSKRHPFDWLVVLASTSLLTGLLGVPAQAAPSRPPGGPSAAMPTAANAPSQPQSLVNDPTTDTTAAATSQNTVSIAVAGPNLVAAYQDSGASGGPQDRHFVGYSTSADRGVTWTDRGSVYDGPLAVYGGPALAVNDSSGRVFLATDGGTSNAVKSVLVFRSNDHGLTFGAPVDVTKQTQGPATGMQPNLAVDNHPGPGRGTVYLGWREAQPGGALRLTTSLDSGNSWTPSIRVSVDQHADVSRVDLVVSPDHCVHVVYRSTRSDPVNTIRARTSCDRGQTLGPERVVAALSQPASEHQGLNGQFIAPTEPQVAINPVTGALYVVYHDITPVRGADAFLVTSTDGGASWSGPTRIGADRVRHDQFAPSVAVIGDGTQLLVSFYDRRTDLFNLNVERWGQIGLIDTGSATHPVQWRRDFPLSPGFRPPDCCDVDTPPVFFSDYEEIAAEDDTFYSAWTDNRDGDSFSPFQPDIRAARVPIDATTDVGVRLTGSTTPLALGAEYFYTATVTNSSPNPAANVVVRTSLPLGARFSLVALGLPGSCYRLGLDISCVLGTLAAGASGPITIGGQALQRGPLARTVTVTTSTPEVRALDNVASLPATVSGAATVVSTFSTGDIAVRIPAPGGETTYVPLDIPATVGIPLDIDVVLRARHPDIQELDIALIAPSGQVRPLSTNNGSSGQNDYGTGPNRCSGNTVVFDDSAATSIIDGPSTLVGTFRPEGTLADLAGARYDGRWQLRIIDPTSALVGTVGCFQLRIRHTV